MDSLRTACSHSGGLYTQGKYSSKRMTGSSILGTSLLSQWQIGLLGNWCCSNSIKTVLPGCQRAKVCSKDSWMSWYSICGCGPEVSGPHLGWI